MFRRLRDLWAFLAAAAAAVLLRGLAAALPCPATEVLSPINESPWELGKLVFWPYLTAALRAGLDLGRGPGPMDHTLGGRTKQTQAFFDFLEEQE